MSNRTLTDDQEQELLRAYEAGENGRQIASRLGVSNRLVYQAIRRAGGEVRTVYESRNNWRGTPEQVTELIGLYQSGQSVKQVARHFRCRSDVVSEVLLTKKVRLHPGGRLHPRLSPTGEAELATAYSSGSSLRKLADDYGVSVTTVRNVLRRQGITAREPARPEFWTPEVLARLTHLNAEGFTEQYIATELGVSVGAVNRRLRFLGLASSEPRARGASHGGWKGGRSVHGSGYILITPSEEDLQYVTTNLAGYAMEHRLVAGRALGRKLLRIETVHHINGDKTDNRLENLQIRRGPHGAGAVFQCQACGSHDILAVPLSDQESGGRP